MNDVSNAKQQIVDRIKNSTNILVTVSQSPSVDELSAALAVTAFLNKLKKHATAVMSGDIPPAINFLEPDKTFENTVDSLRDFIIALNKEKADHLRYKVEGEVVKIFITPYRTTITNDDLDFSQGDYNVELVLALGVSSEAHLDTALEAHGRILHDATVATITAGETRSDLGSVDWHDDNASSVSEMLIGLTEALKNEHAQLDEGIATALLTGIVAATNRFSNDKTSSRVMTMAAQLMAAGANQQLIAARLEEASAITPPTLPPDNTASDMNRGNSDGTTNLNEGESSKLDRDGPSKRSRRSKQKKNNDGELNISHEKRGDLDEISRLVADERQAEAARTAESKLADQLQQQSPAANVPSVADLQNDIQTAAENVNASVNATITNEPTPRGDMPPLPPQPQAEVPAPQPQPLDMAAPGQANQQVSPASSPENYTNEPMLGGTLNATTEQAAEDKRREEARDRNKKILSHGEYIGSGEPTFSSPINSASSHEEGSIDPFSGAPASKMTGFELPPEAPTAKAPETIMPPSMPPSNGPTLADIDAENRTTSSQHNEARAEVEAAFNNASEGLAFEEVPAPQFSVPTPPAPQEVPEAAPILPPLPDFSTLPSLPSEPQPQLQPQAQPEPQSQAPTDPFTQMPPLPQSTTPPNTSSSAQETPTLQAPQAQAPSPTQFRIPGQ